MKTLWHDKFKKDLLFIKKQKYNMMLHKESLMSEILNLDLPLFLLVELSTTFDTLNEFKIKNIHYNKQHLLSFLENIQQQYMIHIKNFVDSTSNKIHHLLPEHHGLLTQEMIDKQLYPNCNAQQNCSIKCLFSVKCLLMIKECINKKEFRDQVKKDEEIAHQKPLWRIYNKKKITQ